MKTFRNEINRSVMNAIVIASVPFVLNCGGDVSAPVFQEQPQDQSVALGGSVIFKVVAEAKPAAAIQWEKNGQPISGATSSVLNYGPVEAADQGAEFRAVASNSVGKTLSRKALLTLTGAPAITEQPQGQTVTLGGSVTFEVGVDASPAANFQWMKDGQPLPGALSSSLTYGPVQESDQGTKFQVMVTNPLGKVSSKEAILTVTDIPVLAILEQPKSLTVTEGEGATFTVKSTGKPAYQWKRDGQAIPGATTATYSLSKAQLLDDGAKFSVSLTTPTQTLDSQTASLSVKKVVVHVKPGIVQQPASLAVKVGESATFTVGATGDPAPSYQWRRNDVAIAGATGSSYTLAKAQLSDQGAKFNVVVSNIAGELLSGDAYLAVSEVEQAPVIVQQPVDVKVSEGGDAVFSVMATGIPQPIYQWRKNGQNVPGAAGAFHKCIGALLSDDGSKWDVLVSNALGSVTSTAATLTVTPKPGLAPAILTQPQSQSVEEGQSATFSFSASGDPAPQFQWMKNGTDIPGATNPTYTMPNASLKDDGALFSARATNSLGTATSSEAKLSVKPSATFTVTFVVSGNGTLNGELVQKVAPGGSTASVTAQAAEGNVFNFWTGCGPSINSNAAITLSNVNQDMTITACFVPKGKTALDRMGLNVRGIDNKGASVTMADNYGSVMIVELIRTSCVPCNNAAPAFEATYKSYQSKGLKCISLLYSNDKYGKPTAEQLQAWIDKHSLTMLVQNDLSGSVTGAAYWFYADATEGTPCYVVLDKTFMIRCLSKTLGAAESVAASLL